MLGAANDFVSLMEPVARRLLGEPNQRLSKGANLRFGTHGSMSINLAKGHFYDHENQVGGGVLNLVEHKLGCSRDGAVDWVRNEGFLPGPTGFGLVSKTVEQPASVECTYDYVDEAGDLLYQVVRYKPKAFKQRRPGPKAGEWVWNLGDTRRVLYCLPQIMEAALANRGIFICEGEKDADNLVKLGLTATTNAGGAGKWLPEYSDVLRNADVVIVPDNDDAGRDHATAVAMSLNGIAERIRILDLANSWSECPAKGDISDWLGAGGTADKLASLVAALPDWNPPLGPHKISSISEKESWPVLDEAAYHGLAGDLVGIIEPHSEADPVAILIQFLAAFGSCVGNSPYYLVESDRHHTNLFTVLVGTSSKGRKGTAAGRVRAIMEAVDEQWANARRVWGLSSGEGLIFAVHDGVKKWNSEEQCNEIVDPGVSDKRLMVTEPEFANALSVMERPGNTLSPVVRNAWDDQPLQTLTKNSPLTATNTHISIIGHITDAEARARLTRTDMANGFANRFLFVCVKRSKFLPHGGNVSESELAQLGDRVKTAVDFARGVGRVKMTTAAATAWAAAYPELSAERSGLIGAVIGRAEAQAVRLALIYALLDHKDFIDTVHLEAALAVWAYAEASAVRIFGNSLGDPIADDILAGLRRSSGGLTRTDISNLFGRHRSSEQVGIALELLLKRGRAECKTRHTGGRPVETWFALEASK